jgi:hypothetical protein
MEELFPGRWGEALEAIEVDGPQTPFDNDRFFLWSQGRSRIRLVEHWYRAKGQWRFAFYAGTTLLQEGISPFFDEKGSTVSRYDAFAIRVDVNGDHYGFVRNLRGPQDAMNQHRSKALHIMNTRQLVVNKRALGGDAADIERLRKEAARPDGVILYDGDKGDIEITQPAQEFLQQTQYYQDAKAEIDSFGPNAALSGRAPNDLSGRALIIQQQAGLAELGPFLSAWRGWKLRIYRKIWVALQRNWTSERMIRVTNNQQVAQFMSINRLAADPYGRPMLVNAIGQIDVDILVDEGPNAANVMGDVNDTLIALANNRVPIPPAVIIQTSSLPQSKKDELIQQMQQPDPLKQAALQADMQNKQADTAKKAADAQSAQAAAVHKLALAHHEVHRAHSTGTMTALDTMQAVQPVQQGPQVDIAQQEQARMLSQGKRV